MVQLKIKVQNIGKHWFFLAALLESFWLLITTFKPKNLLPGLQFCR